MTDFPSSKELLLRCHSAITHMDGGRKYDKLLADLDAAMTADEPKALQERIDFAIRELSEPAISSSAAEWVRVSVLAVLRGQVSPDGHICGTPTASCDVSCMERAAQPPTVLHDAAQEVVDAYQHRFAAALKDGLFGPIDDQIIALRSALTKEGYRTPAEIGADLSPERRAMVDAAVPLVRAVETSAVEIRVADGVAAAVASFVTECDHGVSLNESCEQCRHPVETTACLVCKATCWEDCYYQHDAPAGCAYREPPSETGDL